MFKNKIVIAITIISIIIVATVLFNLPTKKNDLVKFEPDPIGAFQKPDNITKRDNRSKFSQKSIRLSKSFKQQVTSISSLPQAQKKIQARIKCYKNGSCGPTGINEKDPKYRHFSLSYEINLILDQITDQVTDTNSQQLNKLAKSLETLDDDWVKAKLIKLISILKPTSTNLETLKLTTITSSDPSVYQEALKTMSLKYKEDYSNQVDQFIQKSIQKKSYYVGLYVSSKLNNFLNDNNIKTFKKMLKSLPKSSKKYANVYNALAEYKKK